MYEISMSNGTTYNCIRNITIIELIEELHKYGCISLITVQCERVMIFKDHISSIEYNK